MTKVEFCDKISSLNEKLLESQLEESKLTAALENLNEVRTYTIIIYECNIFPLKVDTILL